MREGETFGSRCLRERWGQKAEQHTLKPKMMLGKEEEPIWELLVKLNHEGTNLWHLKKLKRKVIVTVEVKCQRALWRIAWPFSGTQEVYPRRAKAQKYLLLQPPPLRDHDREKIREIAQFHR